MNEKIKELAKEHLITSEYTECGSQECRKYEFHPEELEEFAKLIIRECCDIVRYVDAVEIKKHFGVE